jgi:hypothetical protein
MWLDVWKRSRTYQLGHWTVVIERNDLVCYLIFKYPGRAFLIVILNTLEYSLFVYPQYPFTIFFIVIARIQYRLLWVLVQRSSTEYTLYYTSCKVQWMYHKIILQEIHTVQILHTYKGYHRVGLGQVRKVQEKQLTVGGTRKNLLSQWNKQLFL